MFLQKAEPEYLEIDLKKTAVIVIDMQNSFCAKGAMMELMGFDVSHVPAIIEPINKINDAGREKGCKVIFVVTTPRFDLRYSGGPNNPVWYKETRKPVEFIKNNPEWHNNFLYKGTWGADFADGLRVEEDDLILEKIRYSAFFQTNLDTLLKTYEIKYTVIVGTATNICIEASIRDAFYLGYFPIMPMDAVTTYAPKYTHDATIFNVKQCYGWVTTSDDLVNLLTESLISPDPAIPVKCDARYISSISAPKSSSLTILSVR